MLRRFADSFSWLGLLFGLLLLSASLTPSLLPRLPVTQGALSGASLAAGYALGVLLAALWRALGFRARRAGRAPTVLIAAITLGLTALTLARMVIWQNSIRERMEMPPVDAGYPFLVLAIAMAAALALILAGRGLLALGRVIGRRLDTLKPGRVAHLLGAVAAVLLVLTLFDTLILQRAMRLADDIFWRMDRVETDGIAPPSHTFASGGPSSQIAWDDIGTNGKDFLTDGPHRDEIAAFTGRYALEPVRVYAGFGSGETFEERAEAALADLIALGGFDRSTLIVATPTGTGWLDDAAVQPLPFMLDGDLAIVSAQYTYVPSWFSILVEPDRSRHAARALFTAIYDHWTNLPPDARPRLYLFGLSLGALGSEASADLATVFADPIHGGLWSGPPFASTTWRRITDARNPGSPEWRPEFRDGALVRFMTAEGIASPPGADWSPMRFVYLQYGSDPMVFFSPDLAFRRPDWLDQPRAPDVSDYFGWYPIVTFLQLAFDVPMAASPPSGYGHTYHATHYIDAWREIIAPEGWRDEDHRRLKAKFADFVAYPL